MVGGSSSLGNKVDLLKQRKMPIGNTAAASTTAMIVDESSQEVTKKKLSLSDLPWDTMGIIFDYTPQVFYRYFRLNKTFTRLINKRRKGLTFREKAIVPEILKHILQNNQTSIKELRFAVQIQRLRATAFD